MTETNYETPTLEEIGSFEDVTLAAVCGGTLDATFPAGTPFGDITCS